LIREDALVAIRTYFLLGVLIAAATSGCAGMSGQRFYDEQDKRARGLNEIVDCPTCPSGHREADAIVQAAQNDEVIPPHSKFHPVPTRPVFAPKVVPATATLAITDSSARRHEQQPQPKPAASTLADSSDAAPAPPTLRTAVAKPAAHSVLVKSSAAAPQPAAEETVASSVLAKPKPAGPKLAEPTLIAPAKIEHTGATPLPAAEMVKPVAAATPSPASRTTATSDGWRPRVAN
jgi:hypothetical protein